jgi:hypothetical protein
VSRIVGQKERMLCDRCRKSTLGKGYVIHERHRGDPEDYRHLVCPECNPAYEQEAHEWEEANPIRVSEGMTRQERTAMIQEWADARHNHLRDWVSSTR